MSYDDEEAALLAAVTRHATAALQAAAAENFEGARDEVEQLSAEHGFDGVMTACQAWADTYIAKVGVPETVVGVASVDARTGHLAVGPDQPRSTRFVVEWLLARRDMDKDAALALVDGIGSNEEMGNCVMALCFAVAFGLRDGPPRIVVV